MDKKNEKPKKTLIDLAKILGLDKDFIEYLEKDFQHDTPSRKFEITRILWEQYLKLKELLTERFYQDLLDEVMMGKRDLEKNLYAQAQAKTEEIIEKLHKGEFYDYLEIQKLRQKIAQMMKMN